jgi:3-mercaptopyruvate sulfurtransferase SseA
VKEGTSASLAQDFMEKGHKKAYALQGGWNDWVAAGYPVEPKEPKK